MNNGLYPLFSQGSSNNFQDAYVHQGPPHHLPQGLNGFNHNASAPVGFDRNMHHGGCSSSRFNPGYGRRIDSNLQKGRGRRREREGAGIKVVIVEAELWAEIMFISWARNQLEQWPMMSKH
jgi:hypothetical protein